MNPLYPHFDRDIEKLREKMCELINEEGYSSRNVIKVSQELDKLIFQYQKKRVNVEQ
ncbi:aspartyl-phosphate phosphatase Spo0E family protein [Fervidibacillus halotolerans]|uniref:Aspartyl-phosphate phosphatase Spo0E family protein n=1 Tax=Fervidibacillus halotolerans TaxID=2980027 RepID=A0A9E8LYD8_9BACI|nr:aspartyl-phosphate phosphatase Spo0E family protein [Fervidibacillus halotolerans]WAA12043.1 aspartyl-phosphate phosphatase Spo0E family protein [Fervidibacillus halotolerans]